MDDNATPPLEVYTRERCYITELMNVGHYPEVSIARARVEPGVTTELHTLSVHEWYVIESGRGDMTVGDGPPRSVAAGDSVAVPAGCAQRIHNSGSTDLIFLCVCTPRFEAGAYTPLE